MYKLAFGKIKEHSVFFLSMSVLLGAGDLFFDINAGMQFVMIAMVTGYSHLIVLNLMDTGWSAQFKPITINGKRAPMVWFFLRYSGLSMALIIPVGAGVFIIAKVLGQSVPKEQVMGFVFITVFPLSLLFYGIFLSLFATMLPATMLFGDASIAAVFQRGKKTFLITFWRLLSGSFLVGLLGFGIQLYLVTKFDWQDNGATSVPEIVKFLRLVLEWFLGIVVAFMAVVAICMAYEEAEKLKAETIDEI